MLSSVYNLDAPSSSHNISEVSMSFLFLDAASLQPRAAQGSMATI